ncbi:hypothetical protein GQ55_6G181100 [Panicum hallii var. hallii]|uniref:VQ domain-containing protein n=1 Tax=Panicum hallii var. hallii TaxID=1504633 RepID=A0A2T7D722_9POAL|nr:hypothetical protein GQ55_6G181100 [Panicum hallii var. hallii]
MRSPGPVSPARRPPPYKTTARARAHGDTLRRSPAVSSLSAAGISPRSGDLLRLPPLVQLVNDSKVVAWCAAAALAPPRPSAPTGRGSARTFRVGGMDSGNSGSLQSSSGGGDDEFDAACGGAAADSSPLSALLSPHPGFGGGGGSSSLIYGLEELGSPPLSHWCPTAAPLPQASAGAPASPPCHGGPAASAPAADHGAAATAAQPAAPARGSRKRARASRRAPTTVLTTDTSNFRAMVQEFTGIPAPPFAGARSRLDNLFPSRSSSAGPAALPQYLLRPFAHSKLHAYPPPASSPAPASVAIAASTVTHAGATAVASGDDSYNQQLTAAAPPALLGTQDHGSGSNSYLSFQGALGGGANKYPLFDDRGGVAPSSAPRPQDPAGFLGLARGSTMSPEGARAHLHPRNGGRGDDELSGLVGGCKATYSSAPPPLERNGRSPPAGGVPTATTTPTAAMRTRGADSWVCGASE